VKTVHSYTAFSMRSLGVEFAPRGREVFPGAMPPSGVSPAVASDGNVS
jgi:hypothetical protein